MACIDHYPLPHAGTSNGWEGGTEREVKGGGVHFQGGDYGGVGCWQTTGKSDAGRLRGVSLGRRGAIDGGGGGPNVTCRP